MIDRSSFTKPIKILNLIAVILIPISIVISIIFLVLGLSILGSLGWIYYGWFFTFDIIEVIVTSILLILYWIRIYPNLKDENIPFGILIELTIYTGISWFLTYWITSAILSAITGLSWLLYILEETGNVRRLRITYRTTF